MAQPDRPSFLDRPAARVLAALVIVLCGTLLAYLHRDDLRTVGAVGKDARNWEASGDPAVPCIAERFAEIDGMVEEGVVDDAQADLFKTRAEAMCRATIGDGEKGPSLPTE